MSLLLEAACSPKVAGNIEVRKIGMLVEHYGIEVRDLRNIEHYGMCDNVRCRS